MSLSLCGEALRRRPKRTGSGGSGRSLRGQKVGKAARQRGGAGWLLRCERPTWTADRCPS